MNKYKKNTKYTNYYEKLSIDFVIYLYKQADNIDQQNEIILFLKDTYYNYFSYKPSIFWLVKEDIDTFLYSLIKDSLNKFNLNSKISFKSFILNNQDYLIKTLLNKKKLNDKYHEQWDTIKVVYFNQNSDDDHNYMENLEWNFNEKSIQDDILINDIKNDLKKMGKKGEMFYNYTYNEMKLRELSDEYWMSIEWCRKIINQVRDIIKIRYT